MEKNYRRAKGNEILRYSFGGLGSNIGYLLVLSYLTFYYTDQLKISPAIVAVLFLVSKVVDALASMLMGLISDRTNSKYGKFRPWIIFGAPVLGINTFLLFWVPSSLSNNGKVIYVFVMFVLYSFVSSSVNIPYHSLTPVMSDDPNQRTTVAMAKQMMGIPANLLVAAAALPLVKLFGNGITGWQGLAALYGSVVILSFWTCASGAKKYDTMEIHNSKKVSTKEKVTIGKQFQLISKNLPLLLLMAAFGFDNLAMALSNAGNMYFFTYNLHRQNLVATFGLISVIATVPTSLLVPMLTRKFGKKKVMLVGYVFATIPLTAMYFLPYTNVAAIIAMLVISAALFQITNITGWAALADCVEYGEWKTGVRGEGTVSSSLTFINKFGNALGGMLTGIMLSAVGYIAGKQQSPAVLDAIRHMKVTVPIIAYVISIIAMLFYPITNEFFVKILNDLKERKNNSTVNNN